MCSGHPLDWTCDECFAKYHQHSTLKHGEFKLCDKCEETARHMCFCCMTLQEEVVGDEVCKECQEDFDKKGRVTT